MPKTHLVPRALPKKSSPGRARFHRSVRGDRVTNVRMKKARQEMGIGAGSCAPKHHQLQCCHQCLREGLAVAACLAPLQQEPSSLLAMMQSRKRVAPNVVRGWLHFVRSLKGKRTKQVMSMAGPCILAYLQGPAKNGRLARRSLRALSRPVSIKCP